MKLNRLICLAALCLSVEATAQEFVYPVGVQSERPTVDRPNSNGYKITTGFREDGHTGVDLATGVEGGVVRAIGSGTVSYRCLGNCSGFGNALLIRHDVAGGPFYSVYTHLRDNSVLVSEGTTVSAGQQIAQVGNTGTGSRGPHLHFAVKTKNQLGCGYITAGACTSEWGQESIYEHPLDFVAARRASSSTLVTYAFTGQVTLVFDDGTPVFWASRGINVAIGSTFSGRLTYDYGTPRTSFDATEQFSVFDGALKSLELTLSGNPTRQLSAPGFIDVTAAYPNTMRLLGPTIVNGYNLYVGLALNSSQTWVSTSPPLPSQLPDLSFLDFSPDRDFRIFDYPSNIQIWGRLTSLIRQ